VQSVAGARKGSPVRNEFKVGDRVRLAASSRCPFTNPGEAGTVVWVSRESAWGGRVLFYHVRLDGRDRGQLSLLYPEELEPAADGDRAAPPG